VKEDEEVPGLLLRILKENRGEFCSGPRLSSLLGVSRTGVWKRIRKLREAGYEISADSRKGYRLDGVPDFLLASEILPRLDTAWLGRHYHHFQRIDSTNDHAMEMAVKGAPRGTVVIAEEQTRGKGRLKRPWASPARRGLYFSAVFRDPLPLARAPQTALVAALALVKLLSRPPYGVEAGIKWPNDVLAGGRKMAGILTEMQADQDLVRFLVMGIGVNVNFSADDLAGPMRYPPTSLALELGHPVDRGELLARLLSALETEYERFLDLGFRELLPELEEHSAIMGRKVLVHCGEERVEGRVSGLTGEGALRLSMVDGTERALWVGDVTRVEETA